MAVPFARRIAAFNQVVTNRVLDPVVWFLPGFGRVELVEPRVYRDERRRAMPALVRPVLRLLGVDEFLEARVAGDRATADQTPTATR